MVYLRQTVKRKVFIFQFSYIIYDTFSIKGENNMTYKKYIKKFDEVYTPTTPILQFLTASNLLGKGLTFLCPADTKQSKFVEVLETLNENVIYGHISEGKDFFEHDYGEYDFILTNPPYSIKNKWLQHSIKLNKPFAYLLPLDSIATKLRADLYENNPNIQFFIHKKRIDFTGKKNPHSANVWVCRNLPDFPHLSVKYLE